MFVCQILACREIHARLQVFPVNLKVVIATGRQMSEVTHPV